MQGHDPPPPADLLFVLRRIGLLNRARIPRSRSHWPVQVACSRPVPVSPGSPGSGFFSPCYTRYVSHHRITIDPAAANEPAIRCYAKAGFRPVGVMRQYERGGDGRFHDGLLMDLLRDELTLGR